MVKRERRAGYSLVEVMMTVAILGIISSIGARIMVQANRAFMLSRTRADLLRQSRASMYVITRELRQAKSNTIVIDRASATQPFYSRITFTTIDGRTMSFQQNGLNLLLVPSNCLVTACQKVLANDLLYLAITFPASDDMTIVSVSMTLQENIYQGRTKSLHMASEQVQVMN